MAGTKTRVMLQPRDRHLLEELDLMRAVDRKQATIVGGFGSATRAKARLLALTRAGILRRTFVGRNKPVYQLAARSGSAKEHSGLFLEHQLAINEIYLALKYTPSAAVGLSLIDWRRFTAPLSSSVQLIPDAYFTLRQNGLLQGLFLEMDLGTETVSTVKRKAEGYLQLAVSGEFSGQFGLPQFRVLVVTTTHTRVRNLRAAISPLTDRIFRFTTLEDIRQQTPWAAVWLRPKGEERLSLL